MFVVCGSLFVVCCVLVVVSCADGCCLFSFWSFVVVDVYSALIVFVVCCVLYAVGWFVFVVGCCMLVVVRRSLSAVCRLLSFFV